MDPKIIEWEDKPLLSQDRQMGTDEASIRLDESWAKSAFLVEALDLESADRINRGFSSAYFKFTDTSLGGGMCINPKPQFTRYADVRDKGRLTDRIDNTVGNYKGKVGMGRYYSEAIDDTSQIIHMRFGVPQFNSLTTFFTGFYNSDASRLAKTGRTSGFFGTLGFLVGLVASVVVWPIIASVALGHVFRFFFNKPSSKFYYLKPTMVPYWSAVNSMVNRIGVNKGLIPSFLKNSSDQKVNTAFEVDGEMLKTLHEMMPDIFSVDGGYDIYAAANKAQRMANALERQVYDEFDNGSYSDFKGFVKKSEQTKLNKPPGNHSFSNMVQNWWSMSEAAKPQEGEGENTEMLMKANPKDSTEPEKPYPSSWSNYLDAEFNDGSAFANFRVDYTGPVNESFSNTVGENDLAGKINSVSSQARSASFSFAGGNIVGGAVGAVAGGVLDAAKSFVGGALDAIGLSGLAAFAGAAFVDIPKNWQSSSASLPKSTYTMQLVSPYGNTISQMNNLYIPLCMLLAGAMPLSTGKQSYTSPFILELYDKGRCQTRLGMIDSLTITRGTGNLGFNKSGQAMAIDISFTVIDMSSVMHMPIAKGFSPLDSDGIFDDDTVFSDYMAVLSSQDLYSQLYKLPKLKLRLAKSVRTLQSLASPAMWASVIHEKTPVGLLDVFYKGTALGGR